MCLHAYNVLVMYITLYIIFIFFLVPLSDCEELHFSAGEFCYSFNNVSNGGCGL